MVRSLAILAIIGVLVTGCGKDPATKAQSFAATFEYQTALKVLNSAAADSSDPEISEMKAVALFVEFRPQDAEREVTRFRKLSPDPAIGSAKIFFRAAQTILREKDRVSEAMMLLDSAAALDPSLRPAITAVVVQRGTEYLSMSDDSGFRLIRYAEQLDPETVTKLRARDPMVARRYEEIGALLQSLPRVQQAGTVFYSIHNRVPAGINELMGSSEGFAGLGRKGWGYAFNLSDGRVTVDARPVRDNFFGLPLGLSFKR